MSLLNATTTAQLGISGDVGEFAAGIKSRKKRMQGLTREQALANATANEGQDSRLRAQADIKPTFDPRTTRAAQFQLNTNDKAAIQAIRGVGSFLSGQSNWNSTNVTQVKDKFNTLMNTVGSSSRSGLQDIWKGVGDFLNGNQHISIENSVHLGSLYQEALAKTNEILDTTVDLNSYQFDAAPAGSQTASKKKRTGTGQLGIRLF